VGWNFGFGGATVTVFVPPPPHAATSPASGISSSSFFMVFPLAVVLDALPSDSAAWIALEARRGGGRRLCRSWAVAGRTKSSREAAQPSSFAPDESPFVGLLQVEAA
jgi:hypothetical protein